MLKIHFIPGSSLPRVIPEGIHPETFMTVPEYSYLGFIARHELTLSLLDTKEVEVSGGCMWERRVVIGHQDFSNTAPSGIVTIRMPIDYAAAPTANEFLAAAARTALSWEKADSYSHWLDLLELPGSAEDSGRFSRYEENAGELLQALGRDLYDELIWQVADKERAR